MFVLSIKKEKQMRKEAPVKPKRVYCSISWSAILQWKRDMPIMLRQDVIALTIVALAFTTMRRVGTFIAHSKKEV